VSLPWFFAADHVPHNGAVTLLGGDGAFSQTTGSGILNDATLGRVIIRSVGSSTLTATSTGQLPYRLIPATQRIAAGMRLNALGGWGSTTNVTTHVSSFMRFAQPGTTTPIISLGAGATGALRVAINGVAHDTAVTLPTGWFYVEASVYMHATAGYVIVRFDGVEVHRVENVNTIGSGAAAVGLVAFTGGVATAAGNLTDLYIREAPETGNPFYGPITLRLLRPNGTVSNDMTLVGATAHGALADPTGTDQGTSYVETQTLGHATEVTLEDLPVGVNSIIAVVPVTVSVAPNGGAPQIDHRLRVGSGGALSLSSPATVGVSNYQSQTRSYTTQPDTTGWSIAAVADLRLRIEAA
jgi:hypothetical protein